MSIILPNQEKIFSLLTSNGYQRKLTGASKFDDWYVRGPTYKMKQNYVYCIIPTFNRLKVVELYSAIEKQTYKNIKIIIINDGSTDGTLNYLEGIDDDNFHFINGDGDLWWGKSINEGFKFVLDKATSQDFILLLNDDTYFDENCVQYFLDDHRDLDRKIILGAYQADIDTKEKQLIIRLIILRQG